MILHDEPRVGLIEWVKSTKPLKDFMEEALEEDEKSNYKSVTAVHSLLHCLPDSPPHSKAFAVHRKFIGGTRAPDYIKMYR